MDRAAGHILLYYCLSDALCLIVCVCVCHKGIDCTQSEYKHAMEDSCFPVWSLCGLSDGLDNCPESTWLT